MSTTVGIQCKGDNSQLSPFVLEEFGRIIHRRLVSAVVVFQHGIDEASGQERQRGGRRPIQATEPRGADQTGGMANAVQAKKQRHRQNTHESKAEGRGLHGEVRTTFEEGRRETRAQRHKRTLDKSKSGGKRERRNMYYLRGGWRARGTKHHARIG